MKQYLVDELRPVDYTKVKAYLDAHCAVKGVEGLYWIPIDADDLQ
jgi:hypothetical protein